MTRPTWPEHFLAVAGLASGMSKDRSTKVGAVIVNNNRQIIATGFNGFPRGINDDRNDYHERPLKYQIVIHAEMNAILQAARCGHGIDDCSLYCTHPPCSRCAGAIIQSGIVHVIYPARVTIPTMIDDLELGMSLLREARVQVCALNIYKEDQP